MKALKIDLNSISLIDIDNDMDALRKAVGADIEAVQTIGLADGGVMIADERGMLKQYPRNDVAKMVAGCTIYGTALIVGSDNNSDEFDDVPENYMELLRLNDELA